MPGKHSSILSSIYFRLAGFILDKKIREIRKSGVFNEQAYLSRYKEVAASGIDPVVHYLLYGRFLEYDPGKNFVLFFHIERSGPPEKGIRALLPWISDAEKIFFERKDEEKARLLNEREIKITGMASREIEPADYSRIYSSPESGNEYEKAQVAYQGLPNPKLIAFYLPQFHPFEENNHFWGKGFTEWTNVTKALPVYQGHHQPKLPGELGFYDLRVGNVMHRQAELAKQAGIFGFCFHHYYFEGKKVMRVPYEYLVSHKELDIPFCLHWANESWSAKFDGWGKEGGMLIEQKHSAEHDILFLNDIEVALKDERYIRIDGKPLLMVYRPGLFPNASETAERWREHARKLGIGDLFLVMAQTNFDPVLDPRIYGFDAAVEFPPHKVRHRDAAQKVRLFDPEYKGHIFNYADVMEYSLSLPKPDYKLFRGIMPAWDNTARIRDSYIYHDATPSIYEEWLAGLSEWTLKNNPPSEQLIFINAWNEWAEGAYLEPDRKFGYAYLNATTRALQKTTGNHEQ